MMFPLALDLADDNMPVAVTCRVLGFSAQAFCKWKANPVTQRDWDDAHLVNAAIDIHHDDLEFGYRLITDEQTAHGITASRNRVNRLCTKQRLWSVYAKKRGLHRTPGLTDLAEHPTAEGKLYSARSRMSAASGSFGYSMAERMTSQLAIDALSNAVALRRPTAGTVVHSGRCSQGGFNWSS